MRQLLALLGVFWTCAAIAEAQRAPSLPPGFDPNRHMLVSEVKPGMKGYGLSVFRGTRIDRFDVEVVSILRNFTPKQDVVLIRASGCNLEHTGSIAGMSGSPIYLKDEQGRERLIGAFAYGWPMMKDPLAGVQPIQYMLSMPLREPEKAQAAADSVAEGGTWSALTAVSQARLHMRQLFESGQAPAPSSRMASLMIPLAVTGLSDEQLQPLTRVLSPMRIMPLQAGGGGIADPAAPARLEPGSVMAVPLLSGDIDMTAVGTCTDVIEGKAYGFGHPFTSEGAVAIPMCSGEINGVIANLVTSFKLGQASKSLGTLLADRTPGVAGSIGGVPPTAPITLRVHYADGSLDETYRFQAVIHPQFTPLLASTAMLGSISAVRQLPHLNTVSYRVHVGFADGREIRLANRVANADTMSFFTEIAAPLSAITDNPYSRLLAQSIEGEVEVVDGARAAEIISAGVPHQSYRPGETIHLNVRVRPFRSAQTVVPLELTIPSDLPDGSYQLIVSDLARYLGNERSSSPYRFTASNLNEVFSATNELTSLRGDAIYVRLATAAPSGLAVGRTALPKLPASQRQLLTSSGRAEVTAYAPSTTRIVPAQWVMSGSSELPIQVSREARPTGRPAPTSQPVLLPAIDVTLPMLAPAPEPAPIPRVP